MYWKPNMCWSDAHRPCSAIYTHTHTSCIAQHAGDDANVTPRYAINQVAISRSVHNMHVLSRSSIKQSRIENTHIVGQRSRTYTNRIKRKKNTAPAAAVCSVWGLGEEPKQLDGAENILHTCIVHLCMRGTRNKWRCYSMHQHRH